MHESGTWYFASCPSLWYSVGNIVSHIILCSIDVSSKVKWTNLRWQKDNISALFCYVIYVCLCYTECTLQCFFWVGYSMVSYWSASRDKEQVISPHVRCVFWWPVVGLITVRCDFLLICIWLSSQCIIMTDDQCKNTMTTALPTKGVNTR